MGVAAAAAAAAALALVVLPQLPPTSGGFQVGPSTTLSARTTWKAGHAVLLAALEPTPAPPQHHVAAALTPF